MKPLKLKCWVVTMETKEKDFPIKRSALTVEVIY